MLKARIILAFIAVVTLSGFTLLGIKGGVEAKELNFQTPKLQSTEARLQLINVKYQQLNLKLKDQASSDKKTIQDLKSQQQQLEKERQDLQNQVQAKAEEKARLAQAAKNAANTLTATQTASAVSATPQVVSTPAPVAAPEPPAVVSGCGDNSYANYIYMHESGCNTGAINSIGCLGIGQACPGSKLRNACPGLDYACQNAFFSSYAIGRYGSWAAAYNFWINNHWW